MLSENDPVFVVDFSEETMRACAADFMAPTEDVATEEKPPPRAPEKSIRAIALVFDWQDDPVLLAINPTKDTAMLDALARLLRGAIITGASVSHLATEYGDDTMKRMYFAKRFPRFVYRGIPATVRPRLPEALWRSVERPRPKKKTS